MGELIAEDTFEHEDAEYAIRVVAEEGRLVARIFAGEEEASRFSYAIEWEGAIDLDDSAAPDLLLVVAERHFKAGES